MRNGGYMFEGMRTELIMLPVEIRDQIVPRLQSSGINFVPSTNRKPRRFQDAGDILTCSHGTAAIDILITKDNFLPELQNFTAVLILQDSGFLSLFKHNPENAALRKAISTILYELKGEAPNE
jgi:hypothetical protein